MATQKKSTGRDYPLSTTPEPMPIDNTSVSKVNYKKEELYPAKPDYSYKYSSENYTKKDSADYQKGYKMGIKDVSSNPEGKNVAFGKYKKGDYRIASLSNDVLNAGYNEGINKVLDRKAQKKK